MSFHELNQLLQRNYDLLVLAGISPPQAIPPRKRQAKIYTTADDFSTALKEPVLRVIVNRMRAAQSLR